MFDAVAYASYTAEPRLIFPDPSSLRGSQPNASWPGGYQGYARCVAPCQAPVGSERSLKFGADSLAGLLFGSAACTPSDCTWAGQSRIWAWSKSSPVLLQQYTVRTVEFSLRLMKIPSSGAFRAAVSSETFSIGVEGGTNGAALLSLVFDSLGPFTCEKCSIFVDTWTDIAVNIAVSTESEPVCRVLIYINGTLKNFQLPEQGVEITSAFVGRWGLALGRRMPDAAYLTQLTRIDDDNSSYFDGTLARLRLWGTEYIPGNHSTMLSSANCARLASEGAAGLLACLDLNGSLEDASGSIMLSPRYGDKFLPWCTAVDDGGEFILYESGSYNSQKDFGENWGFCSESIPLPSTGYNYDPAAMALLAMAQSLADINLQHPGCGRVPIRFIQNRASGKGGAVYRDSCDTASSRRSQCFIDGNSPQSGYAQTHQVLFVGNEAGIAGGAVYVECMTFGPGCVDMLNATLALPLAGGPQQQVFFSANRALGWGNDLATAPARIDFVQQLEGAAPASSQATDMTRVTSLQSSINDRMHLVQTEISNNGMGSNQSRSILSHNSMYSSSERMLGLESDMTATSDRQYVPGLDTINFTVILFDNRSMIVRGSNDVVRVRVCASVANGDCFDDAASLIPVPFFPFNSQTGLCTAAGGQPIVCASGERSVNVQFSLAGSEIAPLVASVLCLPCPPGSAQQEDLIHGSWQCVRCGPDQYVLDSNNPSYTCENCPAGAKCNGSALYSLVPGAVWVADVKTGRYLLEACPPSYFIVNTDSNGVFSQDIQACGLCPATFYCLGGIVPKSPCPSNSFAPAGANSSGACKAAVFIDVSVRLPISAAIFSVSMQQEFAQALATASGASYDRVTGVRASAVARRSNESGTSLDDAVTVDASIAANTLVAAQEMSSELNEAALNQQFLQNGIPAGILLSVQIRRDVMVDPVPIGLIIGIIVPAAAVLILAGTLFLLNFLKVKQSPEEVLLKNAVLCLRRQLGIMPNDGFVLSTESVPWRMRGHEVVYLQRGHIEAAARVCLYQHFDVHQFDAFCLCLEGERRAAKSASCSMLPSRSGSTKTSPHNDEEIAPYQMLCNIVLHIATTLIRPDVCTKNLESGVYSSNRDVTALQTGMELSRKRRQWSLGSFGSETQFRISNDCPLPVEMRSRYFTNYVRKARIWHDDDHKLFRQLQVTAFLNLFSVYCTKTAVC